MIDCLENDNYNMKYVLVKLGGSVITDYLDKEVVFNKSNARKIGLELKKITKPLIIVHGNGTFGKNVLLKNGVLSDFLSHKQKHIAHEFNRQSQRLSKLLVNSFSELDFQVKTVLSSLDMLQCENGIVSIKNVNNLLNSVKAGITPIIHGGIISDISRGFYACSGDIIISELSKKLKPDTIIFLSNVNGVYEHNPPFNEEDIPVKIADWDFWNNMPHKYTVGIGEMHEKLEQALISAQYANRCYIVNGIHSTNINLIMSGNDVGTKVIPRGIN